MKKILSVILSVVLIVTPCVIAARGATDDAAQYPLVVVPGYSASTLMKVNDDGSEEQAWMLNLGGVGGDILEYIVPIARGIGELTMRNADRLSTIIGNEIIDLTKLIVCNPDGTSKYNLRPLLETAEESCWANIRKEYGEDSKYCFFSAYLNNMIASYNVPDSNVFSFMCDFRMGAVDCAARLDAFIDDVLDYTGSEKVNIVCESHGGQVTATYLSLYGEKQKVHNAVLNVPALCGASLAYDLLTQQANLDELELLYFVEFAELLEEDIHWLFEAENLEFVDWIIQGILPPIFKVVGYWGSIWDFCPPEVYEDMKAKWLDPDESALLIEKSDFMHYEVMANYAENLAACRDEYGINITVIAGTDSGCCSGWRQNSDGIISTACSTGSTCAPLDERFSDGYTQVNDCGGKYKVSPDMTVDASTAFLPDNTFFFSKLYHGSEFEDPNARLLIEKALLTDTVKDVYSLPGFPQFRYSANCSHALTAEFDKSAPGYLSSDDEALVITNVSNKEYTLGVINITVDGAPLKFSLKNAGSIKPGESVSIPFKGDVPQVSKTKINITVTYRTQGVTPLGERVFGFTLMNGEAPEYDGSMPFVSTEFVNPLSDLPAGLRTLLKDLGIYNLIVMFIHIVRGLFDNVFGLL